VTEGRVNAEGVRNLPAKVATWVAQQQGKVIGAPKAQQAVRDHAALRSTLPYFRTRKRYFHLCFSIRNANRVESRTFGTHGGSCDRMVLFKSAFSFHEEGIPPEPDKLLVHF